MDRMIGLSDEALAYITRLEQENSQLKHTLEDKTTQYENKVTKLEQENQRLAEKLRIALFRQFGKASERFIGEGQQLLFGNNEQHEDKKETGEEKKIEVKGYCRCARGRKPINQNIPREVITLDLDEGDKHCACGHEMECIGEDVSERLVIIPEQIYVEQLHKKKYACKHCEGTEDEDRPAVRTAKTPGNILPGSIATAGLLSYLFVRKYADHMPFYRQEAGFERIGVEISRQDMSNWQIKIYEKIKPLLKLLKEHLKAGAVLQMDETPMEVMREAGRENASNSYMWFTLGGPPGQKVMWYEYHPSRASESVMPILEEFHGYLQTDGWQSYKTALKHYADITHVGCFAHVRRKFFEAMKAAREGGGKAGGNAETALSYIKGLYTVEQDLREKWKKELITPREFLEEREWRCTPILSGFHRWLESKSTQILPSSALGKAVQYTLNQWVNLKNYLCHEELTPDNNGAERGIRPFVIGRKNWVMSGSPEGAQSSCALYSLIETAKANKLNPYEYLNTVFIWIADHGASGDWRSILPWNLN
jgi:transposase